jgi:hypothetical protein
MRLLAFLTLFGVVAVTLVSCVTRYKLATKDNPQTKQVGEVNPVGEVSKGYVDVTFAQQECLKGNVESVPTKLVGVAYLKGLPRQSFNSVTRFNKMDAVKDDERGHLVASTFGGPNDDRWNLVPQHISVNRKIANMSSIMARWDEFESYVTDQLKTDGTTVRFTIDVNYESKGCRPISFAVNAKSSAILDTGYCGDFINNPYDRFSVDALTKTQMKQLKCKKPRLQRRHAD